MLHHSSMNCHYIKGCIGITINNPILGMGQESIIFSFRCTAPFVQCANGGHLSQQIYGVQNALIEFYSELFSPFFLIPLQYLQITVGSLGAPNYLSNPHLANLAKASS